MNERMSEKEESIIGKTVLIFVDTFRYKGILLYEDEIIYRIKDLKTLQIMQIPRGTSVLQVVNE